jgi:hypothetical protein
VPSFKATKSGDGFARFPHWILREHNLSMHGVVVLLALISYENKAHTAYPSIASIGTTARVSENTVRKALKELEGAGLVSVQRRLRDEPLGVLRNDSNFYRLHLERPVPLGGTSSGEVPVPHEMKQGYLTTGTLSSTTEVDIDEEASKAHSGERAGDSSDMSVRFATTGQIRYLRDCYIFIHCELPDPADMAHFVAASAEDADAWIKESWAEVEHGGHLLLEDAVLAWREELSPQAVAHAVANSNALHEEGDRCPVRDCDGVFRVAREINDGICRKNDRAHAEGRERNQMRGNY